MLTIAAEVRQAARPVTEEVVAHARAAGADDAGLHDTVLIASAFRMDNRYAGCLAARPPAGSGSYAAAALQIVAQGCLPRASAA